MSGWLNNKGKEAKEKRLGLPKISPRRKNLREGMKEIYLRRKAHRESLALENEDIKAANKRYYGDLKIWI